jgi:putative Ca2+/H+ antiporter (TMEM165/GDT1 family)
MSLAHLLTAFVTIFAVELPDKTFVATLVLATRYRALMVWIGVTAAFLVQTAVAATAGGFIANLPRTPVEIVAGLLFVAGGIILIAGANKADREAEVEEAEVASKARAGVHGLRAIGASFLVLFVAEWGDLSQLLTAALVVRTHDPLSIGVGAFVALATVSALAAVLGRALLKRVRLATIRRIGGAVCLVLAFITLLEIVGVELPF